MWYINGLFFAFGIWKKMLDTTNKFLYIDFLFKFRTAITNQK